MPDFITAPDGSFTITKDEAEQAYWMYDRMDWDKLETSIPAGACDVDGKKIDRNNEAVKIYLMASMLLSVRFGPDEGATKAGEYLSKYPYFEPMIEAMVKSFENHEKECGCHE